MEHKICFPEDKSAFTALHDRLQSYYGRDSEWAQDLRTRDAVSTLQARLFAYDLEHRARHKSCTVDIFPEEEAKEWRGDVTDAKRGRAAVAAMGKGDWVGGEKRRGEEEDDRSAGREEEEMDAGEQGERRLRTRIRDSKIESGPFISTESNG
ncbi:hypothetical protein Droror1_Dr00020759 [Drosera rotundifolia]